MPAWGGSIKGNVVSNSGSPGKRYTEFDIRSVIPKNWTAIYGGMGITMPLARLGVNGMKPITASANTLISIRNQALPSEVPEYLAGVFASASTSTGTILTLSNVPPGNYELLLYLYNSNNSSPGTIYGINVNGVDATLKIPSNSTYRDFILKMPISITSGSVVLKGNAAYHSPLAGFELNIPNVNGKSPPQAPMNFRLN